MKKLIYIVIAVVLATLIYGCESNSRTKSFVKAYEKGEITNDSLISFFGDSANFKDALDWANIHIKDNDFAYFIQGLAYGIGFSVDRDLLKSKSYFRHSALNGNPLAMRELGGIYLDSPTYKNLDSAFYWFNKAIENGDYGSYSNLARLEWVRKKNLDLPIDTVLIVDYLDKGTTLGDPSCAAQLAGLYSEGVIVERDLRKAYNILSGFPEDKLDGDGLYLLACFYEFGDVISPNFNKASRLVKKSARKGNTNAECKLGIFYQFGQGVEQSDSLAYLQYKKSADSGNPWGMRCVASCYMNGVGVERNVDTAWVWFKSAARNGDIESINYCNQYKVDYEQ